MSKGGLSVRAFALVMAMGVAGRAAAQADDPFDPGGIPRLETSEVVRFGGYDDRPAFTFSSVEAAAVLSGRLVAVVDGQANEVREFDLAGNHVRSFGGRGDGPGEFKFLSAIQPLPGGELAAWDFQTKRVSVFGPDGAHLHTMTVHVQPKALLSTRVYVLPTLRT